MTPQVPDRSLLHQTLPQWKQLPHNVQVRCETSVKQVKLVCISLNL